MYSISFAVYEEANNLFCWFLVLELGVFLGCLNLSIVSYDGIAIASFQLLDVFVILLRSKKYHKFEFIFVVNDSCAVCRVIRVSNFYKLQFTHTLFSLNWTNHIYYIHNICFVSWSILFSIFVYIESNRNEIELFKKKVFSLLKKEKNKTFDICFETFNLTWKIRLFLLKLVMWAMIHLLFITNIYYRNYIFTCAIYWFSSTKRNAQMFNMSNKNFINSNKASKLFPFSLNTLLTAIDSNKETDSISKKFSRLSRAP